MSWLSGCVCAQCLWVVVNRDDGYERRIEHLSRQTMREMMVTTSAEVIGRSVVASVQML